MRRGTCTHCKPHRVSARQVLMKESPHRGASKPVVGVPQGVSAHRLPPAKKSRKCPSNGAEQTPKMGHGSSMWCCRAQQGENPDPSPASATGEWELKQHRAHPEIKTGLNGCSTTPCSIQFLSKSQELAVRGLRLGCMCLGDDQIAPLPRTRGPR